MSDTMTPIRSDHPMKRAWDQYKTTEEYANSKRWAVHIEHTDGSLWAAFESGWRAAEREKERDRE